MRISVVIMNYNYEEFVGDAIDSALALNHRDVEIVVVDDGSTDGSRDIIHSYGDRITALLTENATQRVAANRGFAASTGELVVFLDSDDVLPPDLPRHVLSAWTPSASKFQFRMQRIDRTGRQIGTPFPTFRPVPTPRQIACWSEKTSAYPTPPGSGNAYARWYLEKVMPAPVETGDFIDSLLLAAAPLLGDVVSVPGVVVGYRRHGDNDSDLLSSPTRFGREVVRARARWSVARSLPSVGRAPDDSPLFRSRELLQLRVAARRLDPSADPGLPSDSWLRMVRDAARSYLWPGPDGAAHRIAVAAWSLAVLMAPTCLARRLVAWRYGRFS